MKTKRSIQGIACACLLLGVAGCMPTSDESTSEFFVSLVGRENGYYPNGWGWVPGSTVEISIWNEPDGRGSASTSWKKIITDKVDASTMFGFSSSSPFYPVRRSICGTPLQGQTMTFMVKNITTGKIRMRQAPVDLYYTFQPCR